jgi:hypothetical protein
MNLRRKNNMSQQTKVVTGINTRLSYANIWEPKSINGGKEKYSVSLIIPKSDKKTITAIEKAIDAAIQEGIGKFGGKKPNKATLKLPLRDGDVERDDEAYQDSYFINANSITAPQIVDKHVQPILDRNEVYSGCYARVSINFYALTLTVIVELPVDLATSKRFGMGSRLVAMLVPAMTLPPLMTTVMMIS